MSIWFKSDGKTFIEDEKHPPHAATSPASLVALQSTWRWPGLAGTCPDSLWRAPPAGAEWIPANHQPGAEQCLGNTLQWCRAADTPSGLSPGKQPRWKTSFKNGIVLKNFFKSHWWVTHFDFARSVKSPVLVSMWKKAHVHICRSSFCMQIH